MAEIRDMLESDEMRNVVEALEALRQKFSPPSQTINEVWPMAEVRVGRYNPGKIMRILLDSQPYYTGYKDVLAASFAAWLVIPSDREVREVLMIQAALEHMDRAEIALGEGDFTVERDIAARYLFTGLDFLNEVYDCLGGYQSFRFGAAIDYIYSTFSTVEKPINTAVRALTYLHHAVDRFGRPGFEFTPSLNKAVLIFDALKEPKRGFAFKEKYVSRSLLHKRWSKNKRTLALFYAASTVKINRKTLLQLLLEGIFSYHDHQKYMQLWVSRARYVASHIFARMADKELQQQTDRLLGDGAANRFAPAKMTPIEEICFSEAFRNNIKYMNQ